MTGTVVWAAPLVAVIVAVPTDTPVTVSVPRPLDESDATDGLSIAHATDAPDMVAPEASLTVAESCEVCPTVMLTLGGATVMLAGVWAPTETAALPDLPSLVAVIVAGPTATPVTRPVLSTDATVASDVDHVTTRPESGLPSASTGCAWNWNFCPTLMT